MKDAIDRFIDQFDGDEEYDFVGTVTILKTPGEARKVIHDILEEFSKQTPLGKSALGSGAERGEYNAGETSPKRLAGMMDAYLTTVAPVVFVIAGDSGSEPEVWDDLPLDMTQAADTMQVTPKVLRRRINRNLAACRAAMLRFHRSFHDRWNERDPMPPEGDLLDLWAAQMAMLRRDSPEEAKKLARMFPVLALLSPESKDVS